MAFTYKNNNKTMYVRIKKLKHDNNSKTIEYVYNEHEYVLASTQQGTANPIYIKGSQLNRGTGTISASTVIGSEIQAAYADLMTKFTSAKKV